MCDTSRTPRVWGGMEVHYCQVLIKAGNLMQKEKRVPQLTCTNVYFNG